MVYVTKNDPKDNEWTTYKSGVLHSAEGDVTRQGAVEKKDNRVVICCRKTSSTMVD